VIALSTTGTRTAREVVNDLLSATALAATSEADGVRGQVAARSCHDGRSDQGGQRPESIRKVY
jgi:hypothetical protein